MGGRGSTRWRHHDRAGTVEETPSIDLVALRRAGLFAPAEAVFEMSWTVAGRAVGVAQAHLGRESDGRRNLVLNAAFGGAEEPLQLRLELVAYTPNWGGTRWFLLCPETDCGRRVVRLYVDTEGRRVGCRQCLGLTHRSVQQHDARLDQARRDPEDFYQSREHLNSMRSQLVTAHLGMAAIDVMGAPRRGRGWGRGAHTAFHRVRDQLIEEYERRHNRPFPGRRPIAKQP